MWAEAEWGVVHVELADDSGRWKKISISFMLLLLLLLYLYNSILLFQLSRLVENPPKWQQTQQIPTHTVFVSETVWNTPNNVFAYFKNIRFFFIILRYKMWNRLFLESVDNRVLYLFKSDQNSHKGRRSQPMFLLKNQSCHPLVGQQSSLLVNTRETLGR